MASYISSTWANRADGIHHDLVRSLPRSHRAKTCQISRWIGGLACLPCSSTAGLSGSSYTSRHQLMSMNKPHATLSGPQPWLARLFCRSRLYKHANVANAGLVWMTGWRANYEVGCTTCPILLFAFPSCHLTPSSFHKRMRQRLSLTAFVRPPRCPLTGLVLSQP